MKRLLILPALGLLLSLSSCYYSSSCATYGKGEIPVKKLEQKDQNS